ncbi:MAG: hypothetical protein Q8M92_09225, partial [Candidatus Subteraquimicrobiales bacterium]|nr:hypothetical protein [Candidatus Subteraquimicrobiales bacterium]
MTANDFVDGGSGCVSGLPPQKKPRKREEHRFEINLATACSYMKCRYFKIEDAVFTRKRLRCMKDGDAMNEKKRPFDGMIVTPRDDAHSGGIYAVELKFNSNSLSTHQRDNLADIRRINGMGYVLRMRKSRTKELYIVETHAGDMLYSTDRMDDYV